MMRMQRILVALMVATALGETLLPHAPVAGAEPDNATVAAEGYTDELLYGNFHTCGRVVVFLNGMGEENNETRRELLMRTATDPESDLCFVLPLAPLRYMIDDNGEYFDDDRLMAMWFRIKINSTRTPDAEFYKESLEHLIWRVNRLFKLPHKPRVFVGGFSQGCALALGLAYSNSHRLEGQLVGAMCFSGYIVQQPIQLAAVRRIPLLWVHNPDDQAISFDHPVAVIRFLRDRGLRCEGLTRLRHENHEFLHESLLHMMKFVDSYAPPLPRKDLCDTSTALPTQ